MASHWSTYARPALSDKQIRALDEMAKANSLADGLSVLASANEMSRSKATKTVSNRFQAQQMVNAAFEKFGRRKEA